MFKEYLFNSQLKNRPQRAAVWPVWEEVRTMFILYTSDWQEKNAPMRELQKCLQQEDKSVVLWGISDKKEVLSPNLPTSRILGKKDFTLFGKPKKEVLSDLRRQQYDLFLDVCTGDTLATRYIDLYADATFKAGAKRTEGLLDFMMDMPVEEDVMPLYHQLIHYIQTIRRPE